MRFATLCLSLLLLLATDAASKQHRLRRNRRVQQQQPPVVPIYNITIPPNDEMIDPVLSMIPINHIPDNAHLVGMWSHPMPWPSVSIHLVVLPDGRVMSYGASIDGNYHWGNNFVLWDPQRGFTHDSTVVVPNAQETDSFCASGVLLSDGTYLAAGGGSADGGTATEGSVFDYRTNVATRSSDLNRPRWYGTMTRLPDKRAIETGGSDKYVGYAWEDPIENAPTVSSNAEIYTEGGVGWTMLPNTESLDAFGAENNRYWFPRQWVTNKGTLFGISSNKMWELDPVAGTIRTLADFKTGPDDETLPNVGPTSTAVMYDLNKIIQVGGNGYNDGTFTESSKFATLFDITDVDNLVIRDTTPMAFERQWSNAAVLPDGKVFVVGGSRVNGAAGDQGVLEAEIWDPATEVWTTLPKAQRYRLYHSTLVLLGNGAMLSSGGGIPGPVRNYDSEVYYPPYLFSKQQGKTVFATRPKIVSISSVDMNYGQTMHLQLSSADSTTTISEVSFIALPVSTHGFDSNMRRMRLNFTSTDDNNVIHADMPASPNMATPGYYYISVVDNEGVPSVAIIVGLDTSPPPQPKKFPVDPDHGFEYKEPKWWNLLNHTGGESIHRCQRRQAPPPVSGIVCAMRPKKCFFGTQFCDNGTEYPGKSCTCNGTKNVAGIWTCAQEECPEWTYEDR